MPPKTLQVFVLHDVDDFSHEEISKKLRLSVPNSRRHLSLARSLLKQRLHEWSAEQEETGGDSPNSVSHLVQAFSSGAPNWTEIRQVFFERTTAYFSQVAGKAPEALLARALSATTAEGTVAEAMSAVVLEEESITDEDRAIAAALAEGTLQKKELLEEMGGAFTADQLAKILKISPQAVHGGRQTNLYFGLPVAKGFRYPKFQVTDSGTLKGLKEFLSAFTLPDPWTKLAVLVAPSDRLNGRSPLNAIKTGEIGKAVEVALAYGSHGA